MNRLNQIDANLLVALDVLLEERHVTRAARRLGVSQSAMSQTLKRLREALDDPLLVRSGTRMVVSPRAEAMAGPLRAALSALDAVIGGGADFDPSTARRTFRLTCLDIYGVSLLPALTQHLAEAGPGLAIEVHPFVRDRIWDQLRNGEIELAITGAYDTPVDIDSRPFTRERMVGIVRRGHPLLDGPITPERYAAWPHVVWRITGRGGFAIDEALAEHGVERRIVGSSPYFLAAPALVATTDHIATVQSSAARVFAEHWPIACFETPLGPMDYTAYMAWPNYLDSDGGHQWLRQQLRTIGLTLNPDAASR